MFGIILIICWIASIILAFLSDTSLARNLRTRLITVTGIIAILGGFISLPWVQFDFIAYFDESVLSIIVENIGLLGNIFNIESITDILDKILNGAFLNGVFILGSPFLSLLDHISILIPPILAAFTCILLPFIINFHGSIFNKIIGVFLSGSAFLGIVMLITTFKHIDNLGTTHHIEWSLLAAILGIHIGMGPFITLLGLLLLFIGGLIEIWSEEQPTSHFGQEAMLWE